MRWDNLFDDLESQLEHELSAEEVDLRAEEERLRLGRLTLRDRIVALRASSEGEAGLRVTLSDGTTVLVRAASVGRDWLAGDIGEPDAATPSATQCIIPLDSVVGITLSREQIRASLSPAGPGTEGALSAKLGLAFVLRDLCRRRRNVDLVTLTGTFHGTIDRVGRDHVDLAVHASDSPRRESAVSGYRIVPFAQLVFVRL